MANDLIQKAATANKPKTAEQKTGPSINMIMNTVLDGNGMRKRFDELLGKRAPQFISSIVSTVNADQGLQKAMVDSPLTVVQSALKGATFDLPVDPTLGYGYMVSFRNGKTGKYEAQYIIGYRGMLQLALRTGAYSRVPDAVDVREGELVHYDRLTGDAEFSWIEDEDEREKLPIIGYAGYFRLKNGAEKTIYMTKKQIENHERKNRKGEYMGMGWKNDWDAMARKTVIRRLLSKYGLMSIEYQNGNQDIVNLATAAMQDDQVSDTTEYSNIIDVDATTGEVIENA